MNAPSKPSRWWRVLLFASLALNVFLGGVVSGRLAAQFAQPLALKHRFDEMIAALPADQQQTLRATMRAALREARPQMVALRASRADSIKHMAAPNLDQAALQDDFDRLRQHTNAVQQILQQHFIQTLQTLTPEQRSQLAEAMRRQLPMGRFGQVLQ